MRRDIITMENVLRMADDVFRYDRDVRNIESIDDLIKWFDDFTDKITNNLRAQGLKKDDIIYQYQAVGLAMAYNLTTIPFDKTFLDILDNKNKKEIVQLIRLGNSLRSFATANNEEQFVGVVKLFQHNHNRIQRYEDYYKEIEDQIY